METKDSTFVKLDGNDLLNLIWRFSRDALEKEIPKIKNYL
jgi:hypothetical protein